MVSVKNVLRMIVKYLREYLLKNVVMELNWSLFEVFMIGNKIVSYAGVESSGAKNGGYMLIRMNFNGVYVLGGMEIMFRLFCLVLKIGSVIGCNGEVI